jgi:hypothetical protein
MTTASKEKSLLKIDPDGITNFFEWQAENVPVLQAKYGHLADSFQISH